VETERKYVLDQSYVYILFSRKNGALYVGVTSDLIKRIYEHKNKIKAGYAERFNINKLGYYEIFQDITLAIKREKQLKSGSKQKKLDLINSMNPE
jgi:putative endonuclease